MELSVALALVAIAIALPIIATNPIAARVPNKYDGGPIRRPLSTQPRERCRCGKCEQCDPLRGSTLE